MMNIDEEGFFQNVGMMIKLQSSGSALPCLIEFRDVQ